MSVVVGSGVDDEVTLLLRVLVRRVVDALGVGLVVV